MVAWEEVQEHTGIMLNGNTIRRLNNGCHSDKGWKVLLPEDVEAGDVINVWIAE